MKVVTAVNSVLWGNLMVYLLLGTGVFYSVRLGFPQVRYFCKMFSVTLSGRKSEGGGISSFQALCTGLAAQVGTGNLAGVATAIVSGGPGAVFWMWITALVGMSTIWGEAVLAQVYRVQDSDGTYRGGPAYYLEKGLGKRWMGLLFSVCIILSMPFVFNAVQANSIAAGMRGAFGLKSEYVAAGLVLLTASVIFGGIRRIAKVAEVVVPLMAGLYLLAAFYVVLTHITMIPDVIALIFKSAFGTQQVAAGIMGHTVKQAFRYGVARGLFSNEAGMGSTPNAHATADVKHPTQQGITAMMGVFVDTMFVCTATAALVLLSGTLDSGKTGIELTQLAVSKTLGSFGPIFIGIAILFFAWTTILANYYYGESNIYYLFPKCDIVGLTVYRVAVLSMVIFGTQASVPLVWELADLFNGTMALLNLVGVIALSGVVVALLRDYESQQKAGCSLPVIDPKMLARYNRVK